LNSMAQQFILPLTNKSVLDAGNFIVARCNQQAVEFIGRWPHWPSPAAALFGPKACGKSHLAAIWVGMAQATIISARQLVPAITRQIGSAPLLIEDMDRAMPDAARDDILIGLLDRAGASLLFTGRRPPAQWPAATGDWKSRLHSLIGLEMWSPDDQFLSELVHRHFAGRQLQATASLVSHILAHVERTPDAIAQFVQGIDHKALSEKRPVSLRLVMEMLDDKDSAEFGAYPAPHEPQA
jgi:chromosomal replication initiation ATPase DnaA